MIRLISLDAWNTMLRLDLITKAIAGRLGERIGVDEELVLRIMISVYRELKPKWVSGFISDSAIVDVAQQALSEKLRISRDVVSRAVEDAFKTMDLHELVYPDVWSALEDLSKEFKLAVVSNVFYWPGRLTRMVIESVGLSRLLDAQIYADEVGVAKPDRRIFMRLCDALGILSEEAAHVGDELIEDIGGAISSGMKAILIKRGVRRSTIIGELGLAIIPSLSDLRYALTMLQQYAET
jgi:putative hydrolase of the HAD superfamily